MSYFCSCSSNFRISVRVISLTGFKSHQIHPCYFEVFHKFIPVSYWATARREVRVRTIIVRAVIMAWPTGKNGGTVSTNGKAGCKQEKVVRLLGVDLTHKLRIIFCANFHVQLRSLKENIKTNSRHRWIKKHLQDCLANISKGFFLLLFGIAPCTVRVPKIINIRHQHSFASITFITATEKHASGEYSLDLILSYS